MVQDGLQVEDPAGEGVFRRILGAVGPRVAARLPEDETVPRGQRVTVGVPQVGIAADPVREHERRALAELLVVELYAVVGLDVGHGRDSSPPPLAPDQRPKKSQNSTSSVTGTPSSHAM